jgi:hypothetical protein
VNYIDFRIHRAMIKIKLILVKIKWHMMYTRTTQIPMYERFTININIVWDPSSGILISINL